MTLFERSKRADEYPDVEWIIGGGRSLEAIPGSSPTAALDAIVPDRPVFLPNTAADRRRLSPGPPRVGWDRARLVWSAVETSAEDPGEVGLAGKASAVGDFGGRQVAGAGVREFLAGHLPSLARCAERRGPVMVPRCG
ncbi:hypothetical protein IM697_02115 [Streptomyces ferrugineus]|uniref:Uncharacterized protein n=1 Tax=Streptomyces ferrugineus TaxID=1413221 RepID=A0A7M2T1E9_9ACTN|nr:hypothetical protein [Streptomyces ferrugineus]QOV41598.1 hypothetical protein IM697_02115 [Streptomyces ferrugineus]